MKLSEKIILLRKKEGFSQETLSEKLNVSRQAISRWETGSALPDAENILQISKLFSVTADYLLNDDYEDWKTKPYVESVPENQKTLRIIGIIMMAVGVLGNSIIYILSRCVNVKIYQWRMVEGKRMYCYDGLKGISYKFFIKEYQLEALVVGLVLLCVAGLIIVFVKKRKTEKLKDCLLFRIKNSPSDKKEY